MNYKEHLGNSRMGKGMVCSTMNILTLEHFPPFEGDSYIFPHTQEGIVPRANVVNAPYVCAQSSIVKKKMISSALPPSYASSIYI